MNAVSTTKAKGQVYSQSFGKRLVTDFRRNGELYILVIPVLAYFIIFQYGPMYGAQIAFRNFRPMAGIWGSEWVGFQWFMQFFNSPFFLSRLYNTFRISFLSLVFGFPAPIILALFLNEVKSRKFARTVQTITYMPFFISVVVVAGMLINFLGSTGVITQLLAPFGVPARNMLDNVNYFLPIFILTGIWQGVGWGSIVYLAALQGIDQEQYEAASIDGANRWQQTIHVTIPGILPTIVILLILRMGQMLAVGADLILLIYGPAIYDVADVIQTFVFRQGIENANHSYATAVGLFNSVVNLTFLIGANFLAKKASSDEMSLF